MLIVFSDLDGTLLDHSNYSFDAAKPALSALKERNFPLILASSKTAAEISIIREEMGFSHCPAIAENGGGILSAKGNDSPVEQNSDYARLRALLDEIPAPLRRKYKGFGDWTLEEIRERTGLAQEAAKLAADRSFSEPGIWEGDEEEKGDFFSELRIRGIAARSGGRFLTLSFGGTKASKMDEITALYAGLADKITTLALGDAPNDEEMITNADLGVIIRNVHGTNLPILNGEAGGQITRTELEGPAGWNQAVLSILENPRSSDQHAALEIFVAIHGSGVKTHV